jgi:hypothetical protein
MATTQLSLYNGALRLLKSRALSSLSDNTPERHQLDSVYAGAKAFVLEQAQWSFASASTSLAGTVSSNRGFAYRFTKPSAFCRLISISSSAAYYPPLEEYAEDATYWFANVSTIYITYVSTTVADDLDLWPETYAKVVESYLAMEVAPHLSKSDALTERAEAAYAAALQISTAKDAINRTVRVTSSATTETYKAVLRLLGNRLIKNFDDKIIGRRIYDANGAPATRESQGQGPSLPAYDAEVETILRRLIDEAYEPAIDYLLEQGLWNFGSRTVAIESETDVEPSFGYSDTFEKPDDYVRIIRISDNGTMWPTLDLYEEEGNYWHANVGTLYVQYVSDGVSYGRDTSLWPSSFKKALEAYLALEVAPHAPRMSGRAIEYLQDHYKRCLRDARGKDAINQANERPPPGRLVTARLNGNYGRGQRREN